MAKRMNWDRARPCRQTESKIAPGTILPNGAQVSLLPQDSLAKRAPISRWTDGCEASRPAIEPG